MAPIPAATEDNPLRLATPPHWVETAMADPLALLNDHAHLEKKAATNALDLLLRWPDRVANEPWVQAMTSISRDEVLHLQQVTRILAKRGGRLTRKHSNSYAAGLRNLIRKGEGARELMDCLLTSALIELRSCERFLLLGSHCPDPELARLYDSLHQSENGHYRVFLQLAKDLPRPLPVEERWEELLDAEAKIMAAQPVGSTMHSGWS